jgi:hypothetical protein
MTQEIWHNLHWIPARIGRLWDFVAHCESLQQDCFSLQVGAGVTRFLRYLSLMKGRVVDFACGPGYLVQYLLNSGIACDGLDFSPESVNAVIRL